MPSKIFMTFELSLCYHNSEVVFDFWLIIVVFYEQAVIGCGCENSNLSIVEMLPFSIWSFLEQLICNMIFMRNAPDIFMKVCRVV